MAVEENVVIHVSIDADLAAGHAKVKSTLADIRRETSKLNRAGLDASHGLGKMDNRLTKLKTTADKVLHSLKGMFKTLTKINFIGIAAEIGLVTVALLAVKLALVSGRFLVKAWDVALQGLGVTAAGVAAAIGTLAAALSEFSQVSLAPFIGGMEQAAQAVRSVMGDDLLSFFGTEGLQGALSELAKGGVSVEQSYTRILRQLGNFSADGKGLQTLASTFAQINKEGKVTESTLGSLTKVNPVFAAAIAEISTGDALSGPEADKIAARAVAAGEITAEEFQKALSGELESTNPFEGQLERLNNTLVGQVKGLVVRMGSVFADFGQSFLAPFKDAVASIEFSVTKTLIRLRRSVTSFGVERLIPGLETLIDKSGDFIVRMANEGIPKMERFITATRDVFVDIKDFFLNVRAVIAPLERGFDSLSQLFGPLMTNLFGSGGLGGLIQQMSDSFADNGPTLERFGQALGDFAFSFMGIFRDMADIFVGGMPAMTSFFDVLTHDVMPVFRELFVSFKELAKSALPTITSLVSEMARALLPVLQAISSILSSDFGKLIAPALVLGSKFGVTGAATGAGGAIGGLPGALAAGLGARAIFGRGGAAAAGAAGAGGAGLGFMGMTGAAALQGTQGLTGMARYRAQNPAWYKPGGMTGRMGGNMPQAMGLSRGAGIGIIGAAAGFGGNFAGKTIAGQGGDMTSSVLGGAGTGAATGALIGSFIPIIGTGVGAAIGAVAGGIGGYLGKSQFDALREKAADWAEGATGAITGELERELAKGRGADALEEARVAVQELMGSSDELAESLGISAAEMNAVLLEQTVPVLEEVEAAGRRETEMLERLSSVSNQATSDLRELADVLGINLTEAGNSAYVMLQKLGLIPEQGEVGTSIAGMQESQILESVLGLDSFLGGREKAAQVSTMEAEGNALLSEIGDLIQLGDTAGAEAAMMPLIQNLIAQSQLKYGAEGQELTAMLLTSIEKMGDASSTSYIGEGGAQMLAAIESDLRASIDEQVSMDNPIWDPLKAAAEELGIDFEALHDSIVGLSGTPEDGFPYLTIMLKKSADDLDSFLNLVEEDTGTAWLEANALIKSGALSYHDALVEAGKKALGYGGGDGESTTSTPVFGNDLGAALAYATSFVQPTDIEVPAASTSTTNQTTNQDTSVQVGPNYIQAESLDGITAQVRRDLDRAFRDANERTGRFENIRGGR